MWATWRKNGSTPIWSMSTDTATIVATNKGKPMELYPNDRVRLFTKLLQEAFASGLDIPKLVH